jgi:hypothetical protein
MTKCFFFVLLFTRLDDGFFLLCFSLILFEDLECFNKKFLGRFVTWSELLVHERSLNGIPSLSTLSSYCRFTQASLAPEHQRVSYLVNQFHDSRHLQLNRVIPASVRLHTTPDEKLEPSSLLYGSGVY